MAHEGPDSVTGNSFAVGDAGKQKRRTVYEPALYVGWRRNLAVSYGAEANMRLLSFLAALALFAQTPRGVFEIELWPGEGRVGCEKAVEA